MGFLFQDYTAQIYWGMKKQHPAGFSANRLYNEVGILRDRIMGSSILAKFTLPDLLYQKDCHTENHLFSIKLEAGPSLISASTAAPDLFIQKMRTIYFAIFVFSHPIREEKHPEMMGLAQDTSADFWHARNILLYHHLTKNQNNRSSKYMTEFVDLMERAVFEKARPFFQAVLLIADILSSYPKVDQFLIDLLIEQFGRVQQQQQTVDQNCLITLLLDRYYGLECEFITHRQFILHNKRIQVSQRDILLSASPLPILNSQQFHSEFLDVSKVKSFTDSVFDQLDKSYIKDLDGLLSLESSMINSEIDENKKSVYSSHFSQIIDSNTDLPVHQLASLMKKPLSESFLATELGVLSQIQVGLQAVQEQPSKALAPEGDKESKISQISTRNQFDHHKLEQAMLSSNGSYKESDRNIFSLKLNNYLGKSQEYQVKPTTIFQVKLPLNSKLVLQSKCQVLSPPKLRKVVSDSSFVRTNLQTERQAPKTAAKPLEKCEGGLMRLECKIRTNLKVRNRIGAGFGQESCRIERLFPELSSIKSVDRVCENREVRSRINPLDHQYPNSRKGS